MAGTSSTLVVTTYLLLFVHIVLTEIHTANFKGKEYIRYTIAKHVQTRKDKVMLRFKTTEAYGVLLYSCGKDGDFLLLELKRGKLIYTGDFGSTSKKSGVHRIMLNNQYNNNIWHSVSLVRENGTHVYLTIDGNTKSYTGAMDFKQLNLDNYLYVGGMSKRARLDKNCKSDVKRKKNYTGCLSSVRFNSQDILYATYEKLSMFKAIGDVSFSCPKNNFEIIGFPSERSVLEVSRNILQTNESSYNIELRTFEGHGHILTHLCTDGAIDMDMVGGKIRLILSFLGLSANNAVRIQSNITIDDGDWHRITATIKRNRSMIQLKVDQEEKVYKFPTYFNLNHRLGVFTRDVRFGGNTLKLPGMISCFRSLAIDGNPVTVKSTDIKQKLNVNNVCQIKDLCFPNPCLHGSTCSQSRQVMKCDCKQSGYKGEKCETCIYQRTCEEIWDSGERRSGYYKICPNNERIFQVYCDMRIKATVINHNIKNNTLVSSGEKVGTKTRKFYMHNLEYDETSEAIIDLLNQSPKCRQYIRYDCKNSYLLYDLGDQRHLHFIGARWSSRNYILQNYWGGSNDKKRTCACGMDNSCAKVAGKRKDCNCDIGDGVWRFDAGFITDKSVLPVSAVQFGVDETYEKSFFSVGRLECFGMYPRPTVKTTQMPTTAPTLKPILINPLMFINVTARGRNVHSVVSDEVTKNTTVEPAQTFNKTVALLTYTASITTTPPITTITSRVSTPSTATPRVSTTSTTTPRVSTPSTITARVSTPSTTTPRVTTPPTTTAPIPTTLNGNGTYLSGTSDSKKKVVVGKSRGEFDEDSDDDIFWKPWLIIIVVFGSILCILFIFMIFLLFRQKCLYGKHDSKPRIEIEDYNRYSTATEESSDWDVHRISTTFPTSTPEPSYGPTDDESVNMRVRTLDDVRGKRRFKRLHGWSSQTASAPTVVGADTKPSFSDISNHFYINNSRDNQRMKYDSKTNECYQDGESIAETAYSTTATDGMINGSVADINSVSEYSNKSTNFSTESSLKESEYTSTPVKNISDSSIQKTPSHTINSDQDISPPPQQRRPPYKKPFVPPHGQKHGQQHGVPTDPVKAYYPILPINGFREPSIRRAHPVAHPASYGNHVAMLNNNVGNFALVNGSVARIVAKRSPENTPLLIHPPTIEERDEDNHADNQNLIYENSLNLNGFYGDYDSPNSETRLLFGDANSREECTREADKQIQLLKRKVIEKATSADDSM